MLSHGKKRTVHYGDPGYFDHLPPHLQYQKGFENTGFPFAMGSFGLWSLSYGIDVEDVPVGDAGTLDASKSEGQPA